jgi:hypothetical protein
MQVEWWKKSPTGIQEYKNIKSKEEERKMERIFTTLLTSQLRLTFDTMNKVTTHNILVR